MTFLSRFVFRISMATMSRFSTVANGDEVHIVSTFPAKNAEIIAIIHGLIVYLHPKSYSTCNRQILAI